MTYDSFLQEHPDLVTKKKLTFKKAYKFWHGLLSERIMNIFKWNNLPFPQKEIELLLTFVGFTGFLKFKKAGELGVAYGSMTGVTNYPDIYTKFVFATPKESGVRVIDKDVVIIDNNQIRMPTGIVVDTYATLLAHADLSLQAILINSRATGLVKAKTQQQVDSIAKWYNALANGKTLAILDERDLNSLVGDKGIEMFPMTYPSNMSIDAYYQIRENLLKSFYSEIGINSMRDKRERVVEAELDTNLNRILFNVDDMLNSRQEACEQINKMWGSNISVEFNQEIVMQIDVQPDNITDAATTYNAKVGESN